MAKRTMLRVAVVVLTTVAMMGIAGSLGGGTAFAAPAAPVVGAPAGAAAVADPPTSVRCTTPGHSNPCWATTMNKSDGGRFGCPDRVPLYLRRGGEKCIGGNVLVLIGCFYHGNPVAFGDDYQDHVTAEYAGREHDTGHIPDYFINLDRHNPPDVHIPPC